MKTFNLVNGPTPNVVRDNFFNRRDVVFITDVGTAIAVRMLKIEILNDEGYMAWSIHGCLRDSDGRLNKNHECHIAYSSKNRHGVLEDFGIQEHKDTFDYFEGLTDGELRHEIAMCRELGTDFKKQMEHYLENLDSHGQLVLEAYTSHKLSRVPMFSMLDHQTHYSTAQLEGELVTR